MKLIDRYLYAIGQHLPAGQQQDILRELRSQLEEALEARAGAQPAEADEVAVIQAMGPPREVAASYYPERQYLIGPQLYPLFKTVLGIVFTVVVGLQLFLVLLSTTLSSESINWVTGFWDIIGSLPLALGSVVLIFVALERLEVDFKIEEKAFDPRRLPGRIQGEAVSRGEQVVSIIFSVIFLVILARIAEDGGFTWVDGSGFFENPILEQYFPWVAFSLLVGIVLDIVLLWRGRWQLSTRVATIASNLFSLVVLSFLIQGHTAWLAGEGITGFWEGLVVTPDLFESGGHLFGMAVFRVGLVVAAVITAADTVVAVYRLVQNDLRSGAGANDLVLSG